MLERIPLNISFCILSLFKIWDTFLEIEFPFRNVQPFDVQCQILQEMH